MPAKTNTKILELSLRRCQQGEPIERIARDAEISIQTIYRAKQSVRLHGSVFPLGTTCGRKREVDDDILRVSLSFSLPGRKYLSEYLDIGNNRIP